MQSSQKSGNPEDKENYAIGQLKGGQNKRAKGKSIAKDGQSAAKYAKSNIEYLKSKMKEHFRFFDNHSPELKKRRKGNSHSPPKGKSTSKAN